VGGELCCTTNKVISIDEEGGNFEVSIPPVEDLNGRSACLCLYFGCSCNPEHAPFGVASELTSLCAQGSCGCSMVTGDVDKRACSFAKLAHSCLSCETSETDGEFIISEEACKGMVLCCVEQGSSCKTSCCPKPIVCSGSQCQCCCCYGKSAFPCNGAVPCELGILGCFCINRKETIMEYEQKVKDKKAENAPVEAVIVVTTKANQMNRN
jgi:hypothetical protein